MRSRLSIAKFPDLLPCGSADTGEAGTVSGQSGQPAPQVQAAGIRLPDGQVLTLPDAVPPARSDARTDGTPAREIGLTFSLTELQRRALSFAAMCEAENLQCGHEAHLSEVQEAIQHLWEARSILEGRPA